MAEVGGSGSARGRARWVPVLVAVDAVLVATFFLLVLFLRPAAQTAGPGPGPTTAPPTSQSGRPTTPAPSPTPTPGPAHFRLPSGNIACDMTEQGVTCTIASITFAPPADPPCDGVIGHTVVLDADGVSMPCLPPPAPGVAGDDLPVLFYASSSAVGDYTCTSATNGVTCTDASGVGFRLARAAFTPLP